MRKQNAKKARPTDTEDKAVDFSEPTDDSAKFSELDRAADEHIKRNKKALTELSKW